MCHTAMVPCLCTLPMTQYWNNNVLLSSTSFLNYQSAPKNTIYGFSHANNPVNSLFHFENDQEAGEQVASNEIDSWLLPNPYNNQIDGSLNLASYNGQFDDMPTQGIQPQASLQQTCVGIIPEATFGAMNLQQEWALNQFSFSPFHPGNLEEIVGIHSNSTSIPSLGTQQLCSSDDLKRPSQFPSMSRQEKILRYFEKKKSRKYEKKIIHSSRKIYARTRPRVQGRFARNSQTDA
ncbi:hypothetical protein L1987_69501 [Smallanthus sonchifolius]|uniref:Uncharacterized protein n=1 Tax=Smallanthus sonchifolius TaxID=185202 RepID=A0ACB9B5D4_9ASTR|nr:hypothetical protein L1987_69501 [Smallanthus sonchifolius]